MIKGWLVVNTFLNLEKFQRVYQMLEISFRKWGIVLSTKKAEDISLKVGFKLMDKPDFIIFWDKDFYLASSLKKQDIRLFNSPNAILYSDNKILMYQKLKEKNIRIPRTFVAPKTFEGINYSHRGFLDQVIDEIGFPIVVKEAYGSFGEQVYLAKDIVELNRIVDEIGYKDFLLQEFISSSRGRDIRINVVGNKAIVSMLRENNNDFRSNISSGGKGSFYKPQKKYIDLAIKATKALKLDFAGVDLLFGENDEPIVCEVNSNPQFVSTLQVTGINLADYIAAYIVKSL
ncbi:MAG TPA: RimK family alpha-L-glutamate ligase [Erysipelotrichaceae bacterium]|nr:RimK family alpha-L-glutamate ligase [Erysipelotrichaceae bacterium]